MCGTQFILTFVQSSDHIDHARVLRPTCATQASEMVINPRFALLQGASYRVSLGHEAIGKSDKLRFTRSPNAPADIGLGCPSICGGIIAREGHDDMTAVQPAPHGINSSLGGMYEELTSRLRFLPDANSQEGVHPNANVYI